MRNLKKFLALALAMMMTLSLMVTVNAVTENVVFPDSNTVIDEFYEDVTVMAGMKVIQGHADTGTFAPKANVTRAQMAAIVYRLATGDASDARSDLYKEYHSFSDVRSDAWYAGYVGYCADAGYIQGYPNGTFKPNDPVTGYAALAMILRAMGYNEPGHNFVGASWKAETGATATQRRMLDNINKSIYANTLNNAAPRELVAEMAFQGATKAMVQYTNAFGYQTTGLNNQGNSAGVNSATQNPSLGALYYGLTYAHGVVVGNQATGEKTTRIGFSVQPAVGSQNVTWIDDHAYSYSSSSKYDADLAAWGGLATGTPILRNASNVTWSFNWESDLYMFNHAVRVWFDARNGGVNNKTYALYDDIAVTAVVSTDEATATNITPAAMAAKVDGTADVQNNWSKVEMVAGGNAHFNYSFADMNAENFTTSAGAARTLAISGTNDPVSTISPVLDNDANANHGLYLLISNHTVNGNNVLDVVIPLDLTMSQIVQKNTTTGRASVGVTNKNGTGGTAYFDTWDTSTGTDKTYTSIANANLLNTPKTDLSTKVAAITITGTTGKHLPVGYPENVATAGWVTPGLGLKTASGTVAGTASTTDSTYYYQLTENTKKATYTVTAVDYATQDVTLSNGAILHQSVFAEAVDGTFIPTAVTGATRANEACLVTGPTKISLLQAGRDYTFTLDEQGNYIYWETAAVTSQFVYGTYIDYTTQVASSTFDYPMVYVNANGEGLQKDNITAIDYDADGTASPMTISIYGNNPSGSMPLPKREANSTGFTSGFVRGKYVGYSLNSSGVLRAVTTGNTQGTGFKQADAADFGVAPITINPTDVVLGARGFGTAGQEYYLTENTQFYLVDGAGMENQTVTPFKGLAELMDGMDSVVINATTSAVLATTPTKYLATDATPYDMVYFRTNSFIYDQSYAPSAREVLTVFIPTECVTFNKSMDSSLVFVGKAASTLTNAQGNHATKFDVVRNGVIESIWLDGWVDSTNSIENDKAASVIVANGNNVFYRILDTGRKAADGQPIYTIRRLGNGVTAADVAAANATVIGTYYTGAFTPGSGTGSLATGTASTGTTAPATVAGNFYATTYSQQVGYINITNTVTATNLRNVGGAEVLSLNRNYAIENVAQLCGASSLTDNIGVPVSCVLNTEDATHQTISYIYINAN